MCALLALQGITVSPGLHHCTLADADLCIAWCAGLSLPQPVSVSKRRIVTARAGSSLGPAGTQPGLPGVAMIDTLDSGDSEQSVILGGLLAAPGQQVSGNHLPACRAAPTIGMLLSGSRWRGSLQYHRQPESHGGALVSVHHVEPWCAAV